MHHSIPRIYPITNTVLSGLSHLEQAKSLIDGGARLIQIRDKSASSRDLYEAAVSVVSYARSHDVKIMINDRVDIVLSAKADGVHLGQDDIFPAEARKLLGPDAIIGFSTHTIDQAKAAASMPIDYIAFGPIFSTATKENPEPVVGLDLLGQISGVVGSLPLVAIGGINMENLRSVFDAGADSAAVIDAAVGDGGRITESIASLITIAGQ